MSYRIHLTRGQHHIESKLYHDPLIATLRYEQVVKEVRKILERYHDATVSIRVSLGSGDKIFRSENITADVDNIYVSWKGPEDEEKMREDDETRKKRSER